MSQRATGPPTGGCAARRPRQSASLRGIDSPGAAAHDLVRIEGAGSGAERYLRPQDISNMGLAEPGVDLRGVRPGRPIPPEAAVVILPGSKATRAALLALRAEGWEIDLRAHLRRGGRVVGICAGFQILGRVVRDPEGIEGPPRLPVRGCVWTAAPKARCPGMVG